MLGSSAHAFGSLVRRGLEGPVDSQRLDEQMMAYENSPFEVQSWAVYALVLTAIFSGLVIAVTRYTNFEVISTIAMIESPTTTVLVKSEKPLSEKPDALIEDVLDAEVITIKEKPITHSVASATRYLRAQTGPWFRVRGLAFFVIYNAAHLLIHFGFMNLIGNMFGAMDFVSREARFENANALFVDMFVFAATSAILAPLATAFTHVVISLPSGKRLSEYVPKYSEIRNSSLIGATVGHAIIKRFTFTIPVHLFKGIGLGDTTEINEENVRFVACGALFVFAITIMYAYLLLRASLLLVRVQASLLPKDVEPVVPFDRTFGGKVVSEADGGNGRLSVQDAKPDNATVFRMIKLFARMALIDIKLHILGALLIVGVAYATMGPALQPFIVSTHAQLTKRTLPI